MKKIKVINDYGITISLNFENLDGRVVKILPNSFGYINEDQLLYLTYSSKILENGLLRIAEEDIEKADINKEDVLESVNNKNLFTEERTKELLSLSIEGIKEELKEINNYVGLEELLKKAKEADKAKGYIEAVSKRINELM